MAIEVQVVATTDNGVDFSGNFSLNQLVIPYSLKAQVETKGNSGDSNVELLLLSNTVAPKLAELLQQVAVAHIQNHRNGDVTDQMSHPSTSEGRYSLPNTPSLKTFVRANTSGPWYQLAYRGYFLAREFLLGKEDTTRSQRRVNVAELPETSTQLEEVRVPELIVCDIIPHDECSEDIRIEEVDYNGIKASAKGKRLFCWVIGTTHDSHIPVLNRAATLFLRCPFTDLTIKNDQNLTKATWRNGSILIGHISRMTFDESTLTVNRNVVELIVTKDLVCSVDQGSDNRLLLELRRRIVAGEELNSHLRSVGSLVNLIIEQQLIDSAKVLDAMDSKIRKWEVASASSPLPHATITEDVPQLKRSLQFFRRKIGQTEHVIEQLRVAGVGGDGFFRGVSADDVLRGGKQSLDNLLERVNDSLARIESLFSQHDRWRKVRSDWIMEAFTMAIGVTVPPFIMEILCKYPLKHYEDLHTPLAVGAVCLGFGLVVFAKATDWLPFFGRKE